MRHERWIGSGVRAIHATALAVGLGWLTSTAASPPPSDNPLDVVAEFLPTCLPRFAEIDRRIAENQAADASHYRVPGHPYFRTDRLMGSYAGELDHPDKVDAWLLQLRENDSFSRDIELRNLGLDDLTRSSLLSDLRVCAVWLSFRLLDDPEALAELAAAARPPTESALPDRQEPPLGHQAPDPRLIHLRPPEDPDAARILARFDKLPKDALARTGMTNDGWRALARHYAPRWAVPAEAAPGALYWNTQGALAVDASRPTLYYLPGFARVGRESLIQFTYFYWSGGDAPEGVRGRIWRITLDRQGLPLVYDTLDASGAGHRWLPAQPLQARDLPGEAEPLLPKPLGAGPITVRLADASLNLADVDASASEVGANEYQLLDYERLLTLPLPGGGSRSAFDPLGRLRAAGGPSLPQQWGRHRPRAPLGLAFDDPRLLEVRFRLSGEETGELALIAPRR